MTCPAEDFNEFCYEAAKQFLQTVVVIDNEATFTDNEEDSIIEPLSIISPPSGSISIKGQSVTIDVSEPEGTGNTSADTPVITSSEDTADNVMTSTASTQHGSSQITEPSPSTEQFNRLDAKSLIDSFADEGIICSIMRPHEDETEIVDRATKVASNADIVVVDWFLGATHGKTESWRAKEIIKGILEDDEKNRGRLRLIAVYTGETQNKDILEELQEHLSNFNLDCVELNKGSKLFCIKNKNLKIVVFNKPSVSSSVKKLARVEFGDLPKNLLKQFAELNKGLLPTNAMRSIAAIREETHHLLAVLHQGLDTAFIGHRCLLPHPSDAEEFCEDLIAGEIRSILSLKKIGSTYANSSAHTKWIENTTNGTKPHQYNKHEFTREQLTELIDSGQASHKDFFCEADVDYLIREVNKNSSYDDNHGNKIDLSEAISQIKQDRISASKKYKIQRIKEDTIPQIIAGNQESGLKNNCEFSRLCTLKREAHGLRKPVKGWLPHLTLGTILQQKVDDNKDIFLLCLQPRCDSVRLKQGKEWSFPFLKLSKAKSKLNLILNCFAPDNSAIEKKLFFEPKPRNQVVNIFHSTDGDTVQASENNGIYTFKDIGETSYLWVADMKDDIAQKITTDLSARVASVGLNEFEWLRRRSL